MSWPQRRSDKQGLSNGVIPQGTWRKGPLFEQLSVHPLSTQYLMPTLIRFFIGESLHGGLADIRRRDDWWSHPILGQIQLPTRHKQNHKSYVE